ncbi:MAG: TraB/GumN family protein [Kiloniellaceae bacterium]
MLKSLHTLFRPARLHRAALAAALLWLAPVGAASGAGAGAGELPYGQGLLWQVQREGGGPVSYVLGTIHSTDARLRDLPPPVDQALNQSRVAVFELIDNQDGTAKMARALQLPPGRRLEDILGRDLFKRTADAVAPMGIPVAALQNLKPWALSLYLTFPRVELVRLAQGEPAFDNWLQDQARRRGKSLEALETMDEQIEIFNGMSEAEQVAMVNDMLADYDDIEARFNRIFRAYLKGDLTVAMAEANDVSGVSDVAAAERFKARLIDDRNRLMAARLAPLLRDGGAFVAIGSAHLPGEDGVLARLAARGYRVTRAY